MEQMKMHQFSKIKVDETLIHGSVSPAFKEVEAEFKRNFADRGELGAACAVYLKGKKVVDLWGGYRDIETNSPWEEDTLINVFSVTKGISALAIALAHSRDYFDYDRKVSMYWPEFAENGKGNITIRELLAHQAGLCAIDEQLDIDILSDLDHLSKILARQKPAWAPGEYHGYHCYSLGWYENELIRRTDSKQRTIGQFFSEEIAGPLDVEFYIRTPSDIPEKRIANIVDYSPLKMLFHLNKLTLKMMISYFIPGSLAARTLGNPKVRNPGDIVRPPYRDVEIPSYNGIGTVNSIAKLYGLFACESPVLGIDKEVFSNLKRPAIQPNKCREDKVLQIETSYSLGFMKYSPDMHIGISEECYGSPGYGGAIAFSDPSNQLGFAYAPLKMGYKPFNDPRAEALTAAVYKDLKLQDG
jgi:CubicO group peptidase (beta-lactamase class C family)